MIQLSVYGTQDVPVYPENEGTTIQFMNRCNYGAAVGASRINTVFSAEMVSRQLCPSTNERRVPLRKLNRSRFENVLPSHLSPFLHFVNAADSHTVPECAIPPVCTSNMSSVGLVLRGGLRVCVTY